MCKLRFIIVNLSENNINCVILFKINLYICCVICLASNSTINRKISILKAARWSNQAQATDGTHRRQHFNIAIYVFYINVYALDV